MNASRTTFSAVIPVLNRAHTLAHTLESCVSQQADNLRIIVSDNLSDDGSAAIARQFAERDKRIHLVQPSRRLGQSKHWEFALQQVKSGFFMLLGADDALLPGSVERAEAALRKHPNVKAIHGMAPPSYSYPDLANSHAGHLSLSPNPVFEVRDSNLWLNRMLQATHSILELPYPYGMAWMDISVLQKVEALTGVMIPCRTPPTLFAIAAGLFCEEYVCTIPGFGCPAASLDSIGYNVHSAAGNRGREQEYFDETNVQEKDIPFHPHIGPSRFEHMHIAETLLTLREQGVLPDDFQIAWERFIALAYRDAESGSWSAEHEAENRVHLKHAAKNLGCEKVLELAESHEDLTDWERSLPFELPAPYVPPKPVCLDLRPLGVTDVHVASLVAAGVLDAFCDDPTLTSGVPTSREATEALNALNAMVPFLRQIQALQNELRNRELESNRRATERDRAKRELAEVKLRLSELKNKIKTFKTAQASRSGFFRKLSSVFRAS